MVAPLRIIFAGTSAFAVAGLQTLITARYQLVAVYTQPDRDAGRGRKSSITPVKQLALQYDLPVLQPLHLRDMEVQQQLRSWQADLLVVISYGLILPQAVLEIPRLGGINVHASLLPRWRGAAPIQHAILAGDSIGGVTIMQMVAELDAGPILRTVSCQIHATDTAQSLHERLAQLGSPALLRVLAELQSGTTQPQLQNATAATYAAKISKQDGLINWNTAAAVIERQIRAYNPWPVAYTVLASGQHVRIWEATLADVANVANIAVPGTIVAATAAGIDVATSDAVLRITRLQLPGGRELSCKDCLNAKAHLFTPGTVL